MDDDYWYFVSFWGYMTRLQGLQFFNILQLHGLLTLKVGRERTVIIYT